MDELDPEEVMKAFSNLSMTPKICHCPQQNAPQVDPSLRERFYSTMISKQDFSFPEPIINYIAKNPSSSKLYQKLIKCCKYFFDVNPILCMIQLYSEYGKSDWGLWFNGIEIQDLKKLGSTKLWISCEINVGNTIISPIYPFVNPNICNDDKYFGRVIVPKIWQSNIHKFVLWNQTITLKDFIFVARKVEQIVFVGATVKYYDDGGEVVAVEKLVEVIPGLVFMEYNLPLIPNVVSTNTLEELLKIEHFSNVKEFRLNSLSEAMGLDKLFDAIKKNKTTTFRFSFSFQISDHYKLRLKALMRKIVETKNHDYKIPLIGLSSMDNEDDYEISDKLYEVFQAQQEQEEK